MLDVEIRGAVDQHLRTLHAADESTLFRHELGLCLGETRVDVAAINGKLTGCEIKGASDRLSRLPKQIALYSRVMDESILVTEDRHLGKAMAILPDFWGIWIAAATPDGPRIDVIREPEQSPTLDAFSIVQLLWRDEVLDELKGRGLARGLSRATRFELWDALVLGVPELEELSAVVRSRLKGRREWPGG